MADPVSDFAIQDKLALITSNIRDGAYSAISLPIKLIELGSDKTDVMYIATKSMIDAVQLKNELLQVKKSYENICIVLTEDYTVEVKPTHRIVYCTYKYLSRMMFGLISDQRTFDGFKFCDILVCMGSDCGDVDLSYVTMLWKYYLYNFPAKDYEVPRLIFNSITNRQGLVAISDQNTKSYTFTEKSEPYETIYYRQTEKDSKFDMPYNINILDRILPIVKTVKNGNILIYLPGTMEMSKVSKMLSTEKNLDVNILDVYGVNLGENERKITTGAGKQKIYLVINEYSTYIQYPNIVAVIDTMTKYRLNPTDNGYKTYNIEWISQDMLPQRHNVFGRNKGGKVYILINEIQFKKLPKSDSKEVTRLGNYGVITDLLNLKMPIYTVMSSAGDDNIRKSVEYLTKYGMLEGKLDVVNNGTIAVTEKGNFCKHLNMSPQSMSVLYDIYLKKLPLYPFLVCVCIIDTYGPGYMKDMKTIRTEEDEIIVEGVGENAGSFKFESKITTFKKFVRSNYGDRIVVDDLYGMLLIFHRLMRELGGISIDYKTISQVSNSYELKSNKIIELINMISNNYKILKRYNVDIEIGPFNVDKCHTLFVANLTPNTYITAKLKTSSQGKDTYEDDGIEYIVDYRYSTSINDTKKDSIKIARYIQTKKPNVRLVSFYIV